MTRRCSLGASTRTSTLALHLRFEGHRLLHLPGVTKVTPVCTHTFTFCFTFETVSSASPPQTHAALLPFPTRKPSSCREGVPAVLKYLFCFAEPDFAPRQGHQHSAFVAAELQQAQLVCRGEAGEAVGGLLGAADGGRRGRLKRFYPLLLLPCGHTWRREQSEQLGGTSGSRRERSRA